MIATIILLLAIIQNITTAMDLTILLHLVASKATIIVMKNHMVKTVIIQMLPLSKEAIVADYGEEKNDTNLKCIWMHIFSVWYTFQ